jgi:superoxide dismutase, Cu-Zn family
MFKTKRPWTLATCALLYAGCNRNDGGDEMQPRVEGARGELAAPTQSPASREQAATPKMLKAKVDLKAAEGNKIDGEAELQETDGGVRIVAEVEDTTPGMHGIHFHEKGDCSDIKGKSMGEHFAPGGHPHALPSEAPMRHLGDLGNIDVSKEGNGKLEITVQNANLKPGDAHSFLGKALVIHEAKDVGHSKQPSGDSGTPIACGVVEAD